MVLAAGAGTRFGSAKQLAPLGGRPLLQHPLDALAAAGIDDVVVVLGEEAAAIEAAIAWRTERRRVNPRPQDGLSSSLRVGLDAAAEAPATDAVLIVLGDQPGLRPEVVTIGEGGVTEADLLVHDAHAEDPALALILSRMFWPEFPVPVGVLRDVNKPTHSDLIDAQIQQAIEKSGEGNLAKALVSGETWTVE